jgi:replicative DNA helicase
LLHHKSTNDLKVPVLALSKLSRDIEKRVGANKEPQMSDLRDSGSLEQDANKILFMYPAQDYDDHKIIAVEVAKNRRGHVGDVQFSFDGSHMRHNPIVRYDYVKPYVANRTENPFAGQ